MFSISGGPQAHASFATAASLRRGVPADRGRDRGLAS